MHYNLVLGYWLTMTVLLVFKPEQALSKERFKYRILGAVIGLALCLPIILIQNKTVLVLLLVPFLFLTMVSMSKHYGSYMFFLTASIITVMNIIITDNKLIIFELRMLETFAGVLLAAIFFYIFMWLKNREA
jgi:uncharacterized membrane protein YccC